MFRYQVASADADVRAARAFLHSYAAKVWHLARQSRLSNVVHGLESSQVAVWVTATCARAVDAFYDLAGSDALYETSPLQRRLRDMRGATQHVQVQLRNYETIGGMLVAANSERCS